MEDKDSVKGEVTVSSFKNTTQARKYKYISIISIFALIAILIGSYLYFNSSKSSSKTNSACSNSLLKQANIDIVNNKSLNNVFSSIAKIPNYKQDPNCLYIATTYQLNNDNLSVANLDYNLLVGETKGYFKLNVYLRDLPSIHQLGNELVDEQNANSQLQNQSAKLSKLIRPAEPNIKQQS